MMASTTLQPQIKETENIPAVIKYNNKPMDLTRQNQNESRKTLQTLQYSTGAPISPIRKIVKPQKKNLIQKVQKPITIFVDPPKKKLDDKASQTEKSQNGSDAYNMLVSEEIPESYWKELAEERRKALDESLHENEQLHKEVSELKDENDKLSKVASQAEYFANVLKEVLGAEEEDKDDQDVLNSTDTDEVKSDINEKLGMELLDKSEKEDNDSNEKSHKSEESVSAQLHEDSTTETEDQKTTETKLVSEDS
ncbi:geminin-like [Mytilus californianus]|uniref:geminin-like n=1 Tax=Mytilus californianus TaxID=6549 RepID=UPI0022453A40|nr:geminin-like [Mytilus californianus]